MQPPQLALPGNSMQHVGATTASLRSESQASLARRRENSDVDKPRSASAVRTSNEWQDVPKGPWSITESIRKRAAWLNSCVDCMLNASVFSFVCNYNFPLFIDL